MMNTPIIIFIYKRPDQVNLLMNEISKVKPKEIFIFSDGPANDSEKENIQKAREFTENLNWDVIVHRNYLDQNIGLSRSILNGLDHVFKIREKAIILEEDCIPNLSFFKFCETMLEYYKYEKNVMQISGTNFIEKELELENIDYYFSKFSLPNWGWATWSRAWNHFNHEFNTWNYSSIKTPFNNKPPAIWESVFRSLSMGNRDSWDIQWMLDIWKNDGYVIIPNKNLISNIGSTCESSYTPRISSYINLQTSSIGDISINHDVTFKFDQLLEVKVTEMISEFVTFNRLNNKLSLSRQCVNYLNPKRFHTQSNSLEELKTQIMPLNHLTLLPRNFFEKCLDEIPVIIKPGEWVQIGSWKGGCTLFFKTLIRDLNLNNKLYVYDTFSTIPINKLGHTSDRDFISFFSIQSNIENYKLEVEKLLAQFELKEGVNFIEQDILTLTQDSMPKNISFACIDVDFFEPTLHSLKLIYQNLIIGGVILVDDYYTNLLNCKDAVNLFLEPLLQTEEVKVEPFNNFTIKISKVK